MTPPSIYPGGTGIRNRVAPRLAVRGAPKQHIRMWWGWVYGRNAKKLRNLG
jgi:hypothetical protein